MRGIGHGGKLAGHEATVLLPVLLNVGGDQRAALADRDLGRFDMHPLSTELEIGLPDGPEVARPLGVAARRDQVTLTWTSIGNTETVWALPLDRKSTRLNSSHLVISYA